MAAAGFEEVEEAVDVACDVGLWIDKAVAHACLGGKVDREVELVGGEEVFHFLFVTEVELAEPVVGEGGGTDFFAISSPLDAAFAEAGFFEADVVIVVEGVDANDVVPLFCQSAGEVVSDESGVSGDEYFHGCLFFMSAVLLQKISHGNCSS